MDSTHLKYVVKNFVCTITLCSVETRNSLSGRILLELSEAFLAASRDSEVGVIVICAEGEYFSSSIDSSGIKSAIDSSFEKQREEATVLAKLLTQASGIRKPIFGIVEGIATGSGLTLLCLCDYVFAAKETAEFGIPEIKLGQVPGLAILQLVRKIGESKLRELIITGRMLSANEALEIGLVNKVVPELEINKELKRFIEELRNASITGIGLTKDLLFRTAGMTVQDGLEFAINVTAVSRMNEEIKKSVNNGSETPPKSS